MCSIGLEINHMWTWEKYFKLFHPSQLITVTHFFHYFMSIKSLNCNLASTKAWVNLVLWHHQDQEISTQQKSEPELITCFMFSRPASLVSALSNDFLSNYHILGSISQLQIARSNVLKSVAGAEHHNFN